MGEICKVVVRQRRGSKGLSALANPLGSGGTDGGEWGESGRLPAIMQYHYILLST